MPGDAEGNGIQVYTDSQGSVYDHQQIAKILKLDPKDVEITLVASGGAFGAKEELSIQGQTAMAARLLGRPVKTVLTRQRSTQHHVKRHAMTVKLTVGADADGHLLALRSRIVADAGGYHTTRQVRASRRVSLLRRIVPERRRRGQGGLHQQSQRRRDARLRQQPGAVRDGRHHGHAGREGRRGRLGHPRTEHPQSRRQAGDQVMRESVRGIRETLNAVKDVYKQAKYRGIGCGIKSTGLGNDRGRSHQESAWSKAGASRSSTATPRWARGVYTATMQAVCEETHLPPDIMTVSWDKELGEKCGETWASRGTTLSCAAQQAARKLAADMESVPITIEPRSAAHDNATRMHQLQQLAGREYAVNTSATSRPGPARRSRAEPDHHLTFSYAAQVVLLDDEGKLDRVVVANDVGRAINPRLCAEQMEGGVHMGLGYALSENLHRLMEFLIRWDCAKSASSPPEYARRRRHPDRSARRGRRLRRKGVGEIGCVATAGAVAGALHSCDGVGVSLPMDDAPAAAALLPKRRRAARRSQ